MPKEIKILLPDTAEQECFNITVSNSKNEELICYRYEKWNKKNNNPDHLSRVHFIEQKVKSLKGQWEIAEIYNEENAIIPVLLKRQTQK
jgi:hypothetical protein